MKNERNAPRQLLKPSLFISIFFLTKCLPGVKLTEVSNCHVNGHIMSNTELQGSTQGLMILKIVVFRM